MYLTLGVTILSSISEIQLLLYSQCSVGAPVGIAKASMYLRMALVLLAVLCLNLISPSVES